MPTEKKERRENEFVMHTIRCVECGQEISQKFFPMDNLLSQYYIQDSGLPESLTRMLGIGAIYGQPVLPTVPPLIAKVESVENGTEYLFRAPELRELDSIQETPACFPYVNNEMPTEPLKPVNLNISAVIAQFYWISGFSGIYRMLEIQNLLTTNRDEELQQELDDLCDKFNQLPCVNKASVAKVEILRQNVCECLVEILEFAKKEADFPGKRHFSAVELKIGWGYRKENGIKMPYRLVVADSSGGRHDCTTCCCDKCHTPLPWQHGAYEQRIIGILGTQATGKTTYISALVDTLDWENPLKISDTDSKVYMEHAMASDPHWDRVTRAPRVVADEQAANEGSSAKPGSLWLYQHGFPAEKTLVQKGEAPALSYLVHRTTGAETETLMYTFADIPGEAFEDVYDSDKQLMVEKMQGLLFSCHALIVVVSSRQLGYSSQNDGEKGKGMIKDPSKIMTYYKGFLPKYPVPTAVVITASDEINGGNLRIPLHIPYDIRQCMPVVWSNRNQAPVYNVQTMSNACDAVRKYIDAHFGSFIQSVDTAMKVDAAGKVPVLEVFAVSNGTQCAPRYYEESRTDVAYHSDEQCQKRLVEMRKARFGVAAPFLWLLTCDGVLAPGISDYDENQYPDDVRKAIDKRLKGLVK